jgi:membrane dipeptidase
VLIADGHLPLAASALALRRDLTQAVPVLRERESGARRVPSRHKDSLERRVGPLLAGQGPARVGLPEMRAGRVGLAVALLGGRVQTSGPDQARGGRTREVAYAIARSHLAYYRALVGEGELAWVRDVAELDACLGAWERPTARTPVGVILAIECADAILDAAQVAEWHRAGVRSVALTHLGLHVYGHGAHARGGLFPAAYPLLDALAASGIVLDLGRLATLALRETLDRWRGPVWVSHANAAALAPAPENLGDEAIRAVAGRGGVVSLACSAALLTPPGTDAAPAAGADAAGPSLSAVADHVDHVCQLLGGADHVALGTGLDGSFGRDVAPADVDTIADLPRFLDILRSRGYGADDVRKIAHGNLVRFFRAAWSRPR